MGVKYLWKMLPFEYETPTNQKLAIDASIWLHHYKNIDHTLFRFYSIKRILKLLFDKNTPIFIFDGKTPNLKRRTVIERLKLKENVRSLAQKFLRKDFCKICKLTYDRCEHASIKKSELIFENKEEIETKRPVHWGRYYDDEIKIIDNDNFSKFSKKKKLQILIELREKRKLPLRMNNTDENLDFSIKQIENVKKRHRITAMIQKLGNEEGHRVMSDSDRLIHYKIEPSMEQVKENDLNDIFDDSEKESYEESKYENKETEDKDMDSGVQKDDFTLLDLSNENIYDFTNLLDENIDESTESSDLESFETEITGDQAEIEQTDEINEFKTSFDCTQAPNQSIPLLSNKYCVDNMIRKEEERHSRDISLNSIRFKQLNESIHLNSYDVKKLQCDNDNHQKRSSEETNKIVLNFTINGQFINSKHTEDFTENSTEIIPSSMIETRIIESNQAIDIQNDQIKTIHGNRVQCKKGEFKQTEVLQADGIKIISNSIKDCKFFESKEGKILQDDEIKSDSDFNYNPKFRNYEEVDDLQDICIKSKSTTMNNRRSIGSVFSKDIKEDKIEGVNSSIEIESDPLNNDKIDKEIQINVTVDSTIRGINETYNTNITEATLNEAINKDSIKEKTEQDVGIKQEKKLPEISEYEKSKNIEYEQMKFNNHHGIEIKRLEFILKEILLAFNIKYIDSPLEADSQCAYLSSIGLVDGIITEDNDVFLFGGTKIYRNYFKKNKEVRVYDINEIEKTIPREKMILLSYFLGSDYTLGVKGYGPKKALIAIEDFVENEEFKEIRNLYYNSPKYEIKYLVEEKINKFGLKKYIKNQNFGKNREKELLFFIDKICQ